ncbi:MAG: hypothetical protein ABW019_04930 [Chitinophagaceae bacterium]
MQLRTDQAVIFKAALLAIRDDFALPDQLETGTMYRMAKFRYYSRGYEDLRFFIGQNGEGYLFLDYCLITDDSISHCRIDHTGAVTLLENLQGQWGWPVLEDEAATQQEHERIRTHNQQVRAVLQQKGLDGTDEHGKSLFEMSTILIGTEWFIETKNMQG